MPPEENEAAANSADKSPTLALWYIALDERQQKTVDFARLYARDFHHGAVGHNDMMLIAKLADLLDAGSN